MLNVLFWNMARRAREDRCVSLARLYSLEILIVAECPQPVQLLDALNTELSGSFWSVPTGDSRLKILSRFPPNAYKTLHREKRFVIEEVSVSGTPTILLVAVHLRSKLRIQEREQEFELRRLGHAIREAENEVGHSRTLLIGDLNSHPFQDGVISADGLHAVVSKADALRGKRRVQGVDYRYFYNPMWRFFGDTPAGPPATYYWSGSGVNTVHHWSMLDQILLRPELLVAYPNETVHIVTKDELGAYGTPDGRPDIDTASDHFPILVQLSQRGK